MAHPEQLGDGKRHGDCEEHEPRTPGPEHQAEHACHPHGHHEAVGVHQRQTSRDDARRRHRTHRAPSVAASPTARHHNVQTIMNSGNPRRKLRWVAIIVVVTLPHWRCRVFIV